MGFLVFSLTIHGADNWELIRNDDGIKVFSKKNDHSGYIEIKGISSVYTNLKACVALMNDVDNFKQWMHATEEASLIKRSGEYQFSYYLHSDIPWPAKDRDVVINLRILRNPKTRTIYTKSHNITGVIPVKEDIQRISSVNSSWEFTPLKNNEIQIIFKTRVQTGIDLPDWLANKIYHLGPFHTIKNMKQIIQKEKYQSADINLNEI